MLKSKDHLISHGVLAVHWDMLTEERLNCGLVVYCPDLKFLRARATDLRKRVAPAFGIEDPAWMQRILDHIVERTNGLALEESMPRTVELLVEREILPKDDSGLQFHLTGVGIFSGEAEELEAKFQKLWVRYVEPEWMNRTS